MNVGSEYIFYLKGYNDAGQGGKSNTVTHLVPKFAPPKDALADQVLVVPGIATLKDVIREIVKEILADE